MPERLTHTSLLIFLLLFFFCLPYSCIIWLWWCGFMTLFAGYITVYRTVFVRERRDIATCQKRSILLHRCDYRLPGIWKPLVRSPDIAMVLFNKIMNPLTTGDYLAFALFYILHESLALLCQRWHIKSIFFLYASRLVGCIFTELISSMLSNLLPYNCSYSLSFLIL